MKGVIIAHFWNNVVFYEGRHNREFFNSCFGSMKGATIAKCWIHVLFYEGRHYREMLDSFLVL